jgi:hypothetical protein
VKDKIIEDQTNTINQLKTTISNTGAQINAANRAARNKVCTCEDGDGPSNDQIRKLSKELDREKQEKETLMNDLSVNNLVKLSPVVNKPFLAHTMAQRSITTIC